MRYFALYLALALTSTACSKGLHGIPTRHQFPRDGAPLRSPCGISYEYDTEALNIPWERVRPPPWHEWTETDALEAEARTVEVLGTVPSFGGPANVCRSFHRATVVFTSAPVWVDRWGRQLAGFTSCGLDKASFVGMGLEYPGSTTGNHATAVWGWRSTAFAHELAHLMQNCQSNPDGLGQDPGYDAAHANWGRSGIASALKGFYAP